MVGRKTWSFTLIMLIIGFMAAIQYRTLKQPIVADTRDEWQLKESLTAKQQQQIELLNEVQKYEGQLAAYKTNQAEEKGQALQSTLKELQEKAGLTDASGRGIILHLQPLFDNMTGTAPILSPQLLQRLVNELNTYGAAAIQIDDQRILATTPIREVNGRVAINDVVLPSLPLEIKVLAADAQKLYDRMKVSTAFDHFAIDNIELIMSKPEADITVSRYDGSIRTKYMEAVKAAEEEK